MARSTIPPVSTDRKQGRIDSTSFSRLGLWATVAFWLSVILLHGIDIGGQWDPLSGGTWAMILLWLAGFGVAWEWVLQHNRRRYRGHVTEPAPPADWSNRWVLILSLVSALGAALIIYDFAVLRGYGFFNVSVATIRRLETIALWEGNKEMSAVSGVGRMLLPAMVPTYYLTVICWTRLTAVTKGALGIGSAVILFEQVQFEGGRFLITLVIGCMIIAYFMFVRPSQPAKRRRSIPYVRLAIVGAILLSFFANVFVSRALDQGGYFWSGYLSLTRGMPIDVDYSAASRFEGPFGPLWFSISMLWVYITHGLSQLDILLSVQHLDHAHGMLQFAQIGQIFTFITGIEIRYDLIANVPIAGTYSTFLGQNYIDFGWIGAVLSGPVLGALTAASVQPFVLGRISMISLPAPMLLAICFFTPIVSVVVNVWPGIIWAAAVGFSARAWNIKMSRSPARRIRPAAVRDARV